MRKMISLLLILCLLPIASTASCKEEESTRAYADSIESLYDIRIVFDEECVYHQPSGDYSIITTPLRSSPLMSMLCAADYTLAQEPLSTVLSAYPDHYFSAFRCPSSPCRTGFCLVIAGHPDDETLLATMQDMFTCVLLSTEVPGATEKECGNAIDHDLEGAKKAAREYLDGVLNLIRE